MREARHGGPGVRFRPATAADVASLVALERVANLAALDHVFPADQVGFPEEGVRQRWREVLAEPGVRVEVVDGDGAPRCLVAYDDVTLRHLAVRPESWGQGLAGAAVARSVAAIRAAGHRPRLWCLAENDRALGLYTHLGWEASGATRACPWPPYPEERELVLRGSTP